MAVSLSTGGRAVTLKAFRLSDVPLDIRLRAARHFAEDSALRGDTDGRDRLLAVLVERSRAGDPAEVGKMVKEVARNPSDRIYWISRKAWEAVMGS